MISLPPLPPSQYVVVSSSDPVALAAYVEEHMTRGWKCQGGVSAAACAWTSDGRKGEETHFDTTYAQAMVRM